MSTGDIILFRAKALGAKVQRVVTRSKYDHVALVLKYNDGGISLLEATNQEGVSIVDY